jgi:Tol biopolymer transport system component
VLWTTDDSSVATISATGEFRGVGHGYVTVTATSEGKHASVAATVVPEELSYDLIYTRESGTNTNEIFIFGLASGGNYTRLNAGTVSRQPAPSPDGNRIAFAVSMTELGTGREIHDIFAVDRSGMNMKQLTTSTDVEDEPAWSPRGNKIAYRRQSGGHSDIWIMNADGTGQTNLTGDLQSSGAYYSYPAWSADGSRIAFSSSSSEGVDTRNGIWTMAPDGSAKRQITNTLTGFDGMPSWSADGRQIAFLRYFGGEGEIAIIGNEGGPVTRITLPGLQVAPKWSPDGRHIAFTQQFGIGSAIYTIRPDGSDLRLRTNLAQSGDAYDVNWISSQ